MRTVPNTLTHERAVAFVDYHNTLHALRRVGRQIDLDDHRRDNLAEQILNVKGFSHLFVISHDDTFERDPYNVVRVVKENGVSRACPEPLVPRPKG